MKVSVHAAKTHLSRLLDRATRGEEVIITRRGRPVAKLVSAGATSSPRKLGALKGRIRVRKDFDSLPEESLASFDGGK
jgi:prevent-host-death family protein